MARDDSADPTSPAEADAEKPYHSKRAHKKSRAGCKNCKVRKVKCDEARPTCRSCRLRNTQCVYSTLASQPASDSGKDDLASNATPNGASPYYSNSSRSSPLPSETALVIPDRSRAGSLEARPTIVIDEPFFRPPTVGADEMKLLWFYTSETYRSFSADGSEGTEVGELMRGGVVRYAFSSNFLMDTVLALSALHLSNMQPNAESTRTVAFYRAKSFAGYRKAIDKADPADYPGLLANSFLLTAMASEPFRMPDEKDMYILDWMVIWKGMGVMRKLVQWQALVDSGLNNLFYRPTPDLTNIEASMPRNLLFLIASIEPDDPDFANVQIYYDTLSYLATLYAKLPDGGVGQLLMLRIITWLTFISHEFVELARQRKPRALIILAHYIVFLKMDIGYWWLKGVGERSLRDICKVIGPEWAEFMKVPMLALEVQVPAELRDLIMADESFPYGDTQGAENTVDYGGQVLVPSIEDVITPYSVAPVEDVVLPYTISPMDDMVSPYVTPPAEDVVFGDVVLRYGTSRTEDGAVPFASPPLE